MRVGRQDIGTTSPVFIIAEIGINHEGDPAVCARMIEAAAAAGADAIKLQTVDPDENYVRGTVSHALFSQALLSREHTAQMFDLARRLNVAPFTTVGDLGTLEWVDRLEPVAYKISSGLMTHHPLIRAAARTGRPLLISTGMATWPDIDATVSVARDMGAVGTGLFHCVSIYPAPLASLNLAAIRRMGERYKMPIGYSDHALGIEAAVLATAAGACMIEKHFTLDPNRAGYDHALSLDQQDFGRMVKRIRAAETMRGDPDRPLSEVEAERARHMRRVLVPRRVIEQGEVFSEDNVALKRPLPGSGGLAPGDYDRVIGARAARLLRPDEPLQESDLS